MIIHGLFIGSIEGEFYVDQPVCVELTEREDEIFLLRFAGRPCEGNFSVSVNVDNSLNMPGGYLIIDAKLANELRRIFHM